MTRESVYSAESLAGFCRAVLERLGFRSEDAEAVTESLVRADLEGNSGHGVSRLPIYSRRIEERRIACRPDIRMEMHGSVLQVDGGNGLGHVVSLRALNAAIPLAQQQGIAGVFIRGSNHFGTAAYYCQKMCEREMALIAVTNSPPGIAPWGGKRAFLGTNPIAFGFPARNRPHVIVDMSSSIVARGKIMLAAKEGKPIPKGWAIDEDGVATTDAQAALQGSVLPLAGPKGYALALAVEIMSAVLSGAAFGPHVNNLYKEDDGPADVGHAFILLDLKRWLDMDRYYAYLDQMLEELKQTPLAQQSNEILYPGERRSRLRQEGERRGIRLPINVQTELIQLGGRWGVNFPTSIDHSR